MSLRALNHAWFVPIAQWAMIFGIVALCQPWMLGLHRYGLTITLAGLVAFLVCSKFSPVREADPEDLDIFDAVPHPRHDPLRPSPDDPRERP